MNNLLWAECLKLLRQRSFYIALLAVMLVQGVIYVVSYFQGAEILDVLLANLSSGFYFSGNLLNGNLILYMVLNSLWFNLPLILMMVTTTLITSEYRDRTFQTLFLRGVPKHSMMVSKYLIALGFSGTVVLLLALSAFGFSYILFGKGDLVVYLGSLNFIPHEDAVYRLILAFLLGAQSMLFFTVISLSLAIIFREVLSAWVVSLVFLVLSNILMKVETGWEFFDQWSFARLQETWQYLFYYEIPVDRIWRNVGILALYTVLAALPGYYWFTKREVL